MTFQWAENPESYRWHLIGPNQVSLCGKKNLTPSGQYVESGLVKINHDRIRCFRCAALFNDLHKKKKAGDRYREKTGGAFKKALRLAAKEAAPKK